MSAPETALEAALRRASADAAQRPAFFSLLLDTVVFAWGTGDVLTRKVKLFGIQMEGQPRLPFFTSVEKLEAFAGKGAPYVASKARDLFQSPDIAQGWVMNPGSTHGVIFTAEQIASLLAQNG
jgi:hypothetical protein